MVSKIFNESNLVYETSSTDLWDQHQMIQKVSDNNLPEPILSLWENARAEFKSRHYQGANDLFTKIIQLYDNDTLLLQTSQQFYTRVLAKAGLANLRLERYDVAKVFYEQAIKLYSNDAPREVLAHAAYVMLRLGQGAEMSPPKANDLFVKADRFYTRARELYGNKETCWLLAGVTYVKFKLGEHKLANQLYKKAAELEAQSANSDDLETTPPDTLVKTACKSFQMKDYEKADVLFTQAIKSYGIRVPSDVLAAANTVKSMIKKRSVDNPEKSGSSQKKQRTEQPFFFDSSNFTSTHPK